MLSRHTDYLALTVTSVLWWHDFHFISLTCGLLSQYLTVLGWTFHVPTISPPTLFKNIINLNLIAWVFATNECYLTAVFCWPPAQPFQSLMTLVLTYSFLSALVQAVSSLKVCTLSFSQISLLSQGIGHMTPPPQLFHPKFIPQISASFVFPLCLL